MQAQIYSHRRILPAAFGSGVGSGNASRPSPSLSEPPAKPESRCQSRPISTAFMTIIRLYFGHAARSRV